MSVGNSSQFSTVATVTNPSQTTDRVAGLSPVTSYQLQLRDEAGTNGQYQAISNTLTTSTESSGGIPEYPSIAVFMLVLAGVFIVSLAVAFKNRQSHRLPSKK